MRPPASWTGAEPVAAGRRVRHRKERLTHGDFSYGLDGYLGSYLAAGFFTGHSDSLNLLVRAKSEQEARGRLWQSLQLHFEFPEFRDFSRRSRADFFAAI